MKIGQRVTIKANAMVGHNIGRFCWHASDIVFTVKSFVGDSVKLVAPGYGYHYTPGQYGRGPIYVSPEDLIPIESGPEVAPETDEAMSLLRDMAHHLAQDPYWRKKAERALELANLAKEESR